MNCETSSQLISRLLDHDLSDIEQAALREHLAQCAACGKLEREQRRLNAAVGALPAPELPPDYSRRLREEVWRKIQTAERQPVSLAFRIMAIAAVLVLDGGDGSRLAAASPAGGSAAAGSGIGNRPKGKGQFHAAPG
jgi:anti-sigma factor RsiW